MPSSDVNTPIISPDRIRKEPWYWATRVVTDSQEAITITRVVKADSTTSQSDSPSTPIRHAEPNADSQGLYSVN